MARCFVIQPFDDGGPYDKRYKDVLLPAITEADLDAYRVDEDRSSSIPIDDIEQNIRSSEICLADITLDNANIWYEVGFAFANNRPVVMICAKPRPTKPPFDIQHRHIIFYTQDSRSDFNKLQTEVTERLKAQIEKAATMQTVASLSPVKTDGLSSYEIAAMISIMENRLSPEDGVTPGDLKKDMRRAGYTDVAVSLSVVSLARKGLIESKQMQGETEEGYYTYPVYVLTALGLDWMLDNQHRFKLRTDEDAARGPEISDEDIPF
jgi:hypothetical protein